MEVFLLQSKNRSAVLKSHVIKQKFTKGDFLMAWMWNNNRNVDCEQV